MIFSFFVFNRYGTCIFHEDYTAGRRGPNEVWVPSAKDNDKFKLTAGLVHSVRYFITAMSKREHLGDGFFAFQTDAYKCHCLEAPTGYRLVMITDPSVALADLKPFLQGVYSGIFVEKVCKDPSYTHAKFCVITNPAFGDLLYRNLQQLSCSGRRDEEVKERSR
eukprot:TRINITY_DN14953_c0_g1_i1.p2 TRINITY_DN14953_c0_g1~~TRINITY_DN14953_c0_g1_i1.p2  ORF type:complete len:164 (+),score=48.59 TRINITY_DN14953_c0_g1_i1:264-755(+)